MNKFIIIIFLKKKKYVSNSDIFVLGEVKALEPSTNSTGLVGLHILAEFVHFLHFPLNVVP